MSQVNIPFQEPAIGAKPCPKCGKVTPHYRHCLYYQDQNAVCCGGEGCGFYQAAATREKALKLWNDSTADTPPTPIVRKDAFPQKKIIDHIPYPHSVCAHCQFRKEKYGATIPEQCLECGFKNQRNEPYTTDLIVYEDEENNNED